MVNTKKLGLARGSLNFVHSCMYLFKVTQKKSLFKKKGFRSYFVPFSDNAPLVTFKLNP